MEGGSSDRKDVGAHSAGRIQPCWLWQASQTPAWQHHELTSEMCRVPGCCRLRLTSSSCCTAAARLLSLTPHPRASQPMLPSSLHWHGSARQPSGGIRDSGCALAAQSQTKRGSGSTDTRLLQQHLMPSEQVSTTSRACFGRQLRWGWRTATGARAHISCSSLQLECTKSAVPCRVLACVYVQANRLRRRLQWRIHQAGASKGLARKQGTGQGSVCLGAHL